MTDAPGMLCWGRTSALKDPDLAQRTPVQPELETHPSGDRGVRQSDSIPLCASFYMPFRRGRPKDTQKRMLVAIGPRWLLIKEDRPRGAVWTSEDKRLVLQQPGNERAQLCKELQAHSWHPFNWWGSCEESTSGASGKQKATGTFILLPCQRLHSLNQNLEGVTQSSTKRA